MVKMDGAGLWSGRASMVEMSMHVLIGVCDAGSCQSAKLVLRVESDTLCGEMLDNSAGSQGNRSARVEVDG